MHHMIFGLFDSSEAATEAVEAVTAAHPECRGQLEIIRHRGELHDYDVHPSESQSRLAMSVAGGIGALGAGAGVGVLAVFLEVPAAMIVLAAFLGGVVGVMIGSIAGSGTPDRRLDALAGHLDDGKVLVSANVAGLTCEEHVEGEFRRRGADVRVRRFV